MRDSISAQSWASVPPAPALMLRMQFFRSCGPFRKTFNSSASSSLKNRARSRVSSFSTWAWASGGSASPSSSMTRKSSSFFSAWSSGSILLRREFASSISVCAFSRLFQKLSAAMSALSSPRRFCALGTSKKPPQMREFPGGVGNVGFDRFEHRCRIPDAESGIQNGIPKSAGPLHFSAMRPSPPGEQQPEQQNQQYQQIETNDDPA